MANATHKKPKAAVAEETMQVVTFHVGGEEYGLDIQSITEIVRPLKVTPLPRMPEFIEGVINLRGIIIPIVDLRKRFGQRDIKDNRRTLRMMITKGAVAGLLGLIVDRVNEVRHLPGRDIEPAPEAAMGEHASLVTGMGKVGDRLIILLNITGILSREERSALAEAGHAGS